MFVLRTENRETNLSPDSVVQPSGREMETKKSVLNLKESSLSQQDVETQNLIGNTHMSSQFDSVSANDDFLEQMLSTIAGNSCSWLPELNVGATEATSSWIGLHKSVDGSPDLDSVPRDPHFNFDDQSLLLPPSKVLQNQINIQQQMLLQCSGIDGSASSDSILRSLPLNLSNGDDICTSPDGNGSVHALCNGFTGSIHRSDQNSNLSQHFHLPHQGQNFGVPTLTGAMNAIPSSSSAGRGTTEPQPRQKARARRGQATDPHSIAERLRRERIAERMKDLQELVPNANKTDKASMLDEIIDYLKFLQLQVKVLSMSRLGGATAAYPRVGDTSETKAVIGGNRAATTTTSGFISSSNSDGTSLTEQQVAKLLEEDMSSAMQYLQSKGLCLMPISLATAISTATSLTNKAPMGDAAAAVGAFKSCGEPSSPNVSVMTVQSNMAKDHVI